MRKTLHLVRKIVCIAVLLVILGIFLYHRILLLKERSLLKDPPSRLVEVDGSNMSIYTEGEGSHTIVIMSSEEMPTPIYEYKPLYSRLSDEYRIAVIEKFGYGFSDVVKGSRDFDTILRQDREALAKAGIEAPYILCPVSMSGLEAIMWAQDYPDEVEAIVGLDMGTPDAYIGVDVSGDDKDLYRNVWLMKESGIIRYFVNDGLFPDDYTQNEKDICKAIFCRKLCNKNVMDERTHVSEAANEINGKPMPDVPTLMIIGSDRGERWKNSRDAYAAGLSRVKTVELGSGKYAYKNEPDRAAEEIKDFAESL